MSEDNSHSHQINQSSMTGNNSSSHIHSGAAVLSNDKKTFARGAGIDQRLGDDVNNIFNTQGINVMQSNANMDHILSPLSEGAMNANLLNACDGVLSPVNGMNFAGQMNQIKTAVLPAEVKNAVGALNADIYENTNVVSSQKGGQSH